jgi:hypothetical protein
MDILCQRQTVQSSLATSPAISGTNRRNGLQRSPTMPPNGLIASMMQLISYSAS